MGEADLPERMLDRKTATHNVADDYAAARGWRSAEEPFVHELIDEPASPRPVNGRPHRQPDLAVARGDTRSRDPLNDVGQRLDPAGWRWSCPLHTANI